MQLTLEITQDYIDRGKADDPTSCPIALAMLDKCPKYDYRVYPEGIGFYHKGKIYQEYIWRVGIPVDISNWISNYDHWVMKTSWIVTTEPKPTSFSIEVPDHLGCQNA